MKLDEAIKELKWHNTFVRDCGYPELAKAQKLGMEALKRVRLLRLMFTNEDAHTLPGETDK